MDIESINRVTANQSFQGDSAVSASSSQLGSNQTAGAIQKELKASVKSVSNGNNIKITDSEDLNTKNAAAGSKKSESEVTLGDMKSISKVINRNTVAEFGYNEPTNRFTIKIKDADTDKVIKEIPSEEALELLAKAWELAGILVDEKR